MRKLHQSHDAARGRAGSLGQGGCQAVKSTSSSHCGSLSLRSHGRVQGPAEPKETACASDPRLVRGNQETTQSISQDAVTAHPSPRTSAPKHSSGKHQCSSGQDSRASGRPPLVNSGFISERLLKLSQPKGYQAEYLQQRPRESPEWPVSRAALSYKASPRILELARPKALHPDFQHARELPTRVTNAAALATASSRTQHLAEPRIKRENCCYELGFPEAVIRPVSKFALEAVASPRTVELAKAKSLHPDYVFPRDPEWPVTRAAMHAELTPRLAELAQPRTRAPMAWVQCDAEAFTVKESAKKATCSARIQELACPVKR